VTRDEALQALGLEFSVAPVEIERALVERVTQLEKRLSAAPTQVLKEKYRRQLEELEQARKVLIGDVAAGGLSQTMMADLPVAQAAYTRGTGSGPVASMGIALQPGQTLAGRYQLHEQIGAGGMGAVFSAFDSNRDKDIAIKVLLPQMLSSPKARERFLREARLSSEMSHPNIATVFDVQQEGVYCFLTMELLRGQSLRTYLRNLRGLRKTMPVDEALRIVGQVCDALAYAHERTVHRDIKPENIWLTDEGKAKVMDFGIATLTNSTQVLETMMEAGTPYYMAPEQLAGLGKVDARADQYAVAVMLYEMLSGQVPTGRIDSLKKTRKDVPSSVSAAVDVALSQRAEERFGSIQEFRSALTKSSLTLPTGNVRMLVQVGGAIALVAVLGASYPMWKGLLPDREAEALAKQEVARLQGEVKSMMKFVDTQRRELKDAVSAAARDADRLEGQIRSARSAEERATLQASLLEVKDRASTAIDIEKRYREQAEGANGLTAIEGEVGAAEAALKSGQVQVAREKFSVALTAISSLKGIPEDASKQLQEARNKVLSQVDGKWGLGSCDQPALFTIKDAMLQQYWPSIGLAEERIIQIAGSAVLTSVQTPVSQRGKLFRYTPVGARLDVEDISTGRSESLQHCG
jgi:serine/threonine protein kinase